MPDNGGVADELIARLHERGVETFVVDGAPPADDLTSALGRLRRRWTGERRLLARGARRGEPHRGDGPRGVARSAARSRQALVHDAARLPRRRPRRRSSSPARASAASTATTTTARSRRSAERSRGSPRRMPASSRRVLVKAVDVAADAAPGTIAAQLVAETLSDPGAVEIGHRDGQRWTVGLHEQPASMPEPGPARSRRTRVRRHRCRGRHRVGDRRRSRGGVRWCVPPPRPHSRARADDADIRRFADDRDGLKRDVIERMRARGRASDAGHGRKGAGARRTVARRTPGDRRGARRRRRRCTTTAST